MFYRILIFKALCISLCVASSLSSSEEAREFIEHVLRVPNPEKVLNSVLGRLQRNRGQNFETRKLVSAESEDCDDPSEVLPEYTESLESRERESRQLSVQKHYPICHLERTIRKLNTIDYEYRPAYYEEIKCSSTNADEVGSYSEICTSLGFSCVQWNKTIHLTRRPYNSDCWETKTMVIPAGCECMWPHHRLGDMTLHL
ncbi:unnamed protein product [Chilo suppressalis]|uniref:Spaetzle domain-containing protein n=1 Tax=Chilo suppressalis TaxID=168631 RepID=A0ABN8EDD2_CHISP|nr:hypothetical protein evm_004317 [Chilo suppressalis]CAH0684668.1 unnamed protein product [Chilo suppressalis]